MFLKHMAQTDDKSGSMLTQLMIGIIFGIAGFALNWFKLELFFNVDFLFGSILTMFVIMRFGLLSGVISAAIAASCTWHHWHQPWAIILFTAEAAFAGFLYRRRGWDIVLGSLLFWFTFGISLVLLFYQFLMGFSFESALLIALKDGMNGVLNSQLATALYVLYRYKDKRYGQLPTFRQVILIVISLFVVIPAFFFLYVDIRRTLANELTAHRKRTVILADVVQRSVSSWLKGSSDVVGYLSAIGKSANGYSNLQLQDNLDSILTAMPEFKRLGIVNESGVTRAFSPSVDDTGVSTVGIDLSDRPYIALAKQRGSGKIVLELINGKIGTPGPRLIIATPIFSQGHYQGASFAVANIDELTRLLNIADMQETNATLVDEKGRVVASTRQELKPLDQFLQPENGSFMLLSDGVNQWIPNTEPGVGAAKRWLASFYLKELPLDNSQGWKVVIETSLKPTLVEIGSQASLLLFGIGVLQLLLIYFSRLFSFKLANIVSRFEEVTRELPVRVLAGENIEWPSPSTLEMESLTDNVKQMTRSLSRSQFELRQINETLERRVNERTSEVILVTKELSIILESAPFGISKLVDRKQVWLNHHLEKLFLYSKDEMALHTTSFLYTSDEAYKEFGKKAYLVLSQGLEFEAVQEMVRKDGEHIFVRFIGKAIDPEDSSKGSIWLSEDVTERKRMEDELRMSKDAAESANRAKSEFLANMSHEIRTPMNGVIGMAQLLDLTELTSEQKEYVAALKISGKNLLSLINDILDLSKIEAGKIRIEPLQFSFSHCMNDILNMQKSLIFEKGLRLNLDMDGKIPNILVGDSLRVKQIMLNLLGNAVKFTNSGEITFSTRLVERCESTVLVQISVKDSGIGIAPDALDEIFKPFVQEDSSTTRNYGGTGLGLTISQRMADLMGGVISVESTQGSGSCFTLMLPFAFIKASSEDEENAADSDVCWDGDTLRILFAEDNPINTSFGTALLEKLGHVVVTAENGSDVLAALENQGRFDLLLMDIQMPVMNGDDALLQIRRKEQETGEHLPVIALTAYSMRGDRERFLKEGFDGYVSKPIVIRELVAEMKRVMERKL